MGYFKKREKFSESRNGVDTKSTGYAFTPAKGCPPVLAVPIQENMTPDEYERSEKEFHKSVAKNLQCASKGIETLNEKFQGINDLIQRLKVEDLSTPSE